MNKYTVKNNRSNNILINDLPEIPVLGPGETHNLLGCTSLERIKESEQLKYCIDKKWISLVSEEIKPKENGELIKIDLENDNLHTKLNKLEKTVFDIEKTHRLIKKIPKKTKYGNTKYVKPAKP